MGFIGLGIALIVVGVLLTVSNVFGFTLGAPLIWLGWISILAGIVLAIVHFATGAARRTAVRRDI